MQIKRLEVTYNYHILCEVDCFGAPVILDNKTYC